MLMALMASPFSLASGRAAGTGGGLLFLGTCCRAGAGGLFLLSGCGGATELASKRFGLLLDENVSIFVSVLLLEAADILEDFVVVTANISP